MKHTFGGHYTCIINMIVWPASSPTNDIEKKRISDKPKLKNDVTEIEEDVN